MPSILIVVTRLMLGSGSTSGLVLGLGRDLRNWPNAQRVQSNAQRIWLNAQMRSLCLI